MPSDTTSSAADFDFAIGSWRVAHRKLKERLAGCSEWIEFAGTSETRKVLGGLGNVEDNLLELPEGACRAVALRSFNPSEQAWAIWWLDGRSPWGIDTPVIGRFVDGVGLFYADDVFNGKPLRIRFTWTKVTDDALRWEQAFSPDAGATWETNWFMSFTRQLQAAVKTPDTRFVSATPVLASLDIERSVGFFCSHLGFTRLHVQLGEYGVVRRGAVGIHFWACAERHIAENTSCRLRVDGIDALFSACSALGIVHPNSSLEITPWGSREFAILDPDGNLVTFTEYAGD